MKKGDVSRRDFGKLTMAAFGGVLAGSMLGSKLMAAGVVKERVPMELHSCRGLNSCKYQGAGHTNECAGVGACSTAEAHSCKGKNSCKHQGGGYDNDCKGKGSCAVPVKGEAWKTARANFEAAMKKAGKKFGPAPKE